MSRPDLSMNGPARYGTWASPVSDELVHVLIGLGSYNTLDRA